MQDRHAYLQTANASRYLQQLCKHFGHKVPVDFCPDEGRIDLPFGICRLKATQDGLHLSVSAEMGAITRMERVITDHLARFAFRENLSPDWQSTPPHPERTTHD